MTIQQLPVYTGEIPALGQEQSQFNTNVSDKLAYDAQLVPAQNVYATEANALAAQVQSDASDAESSAAAAEASAYGLNYQGLWPDTGGVGNKGDTYQTQVSGTPTGQYFTALQNTTSYPVGDDVNWRSVIGEQYVTTAQSEILGGELFKGSNGETVEIGDFIELGTSYLRVSVYGKPAIVAFSPIISGGVSLLTDVSATVGGVTVPFESPKNLTQKTSKNLYVENLISARNNYGVQPDNFYDFKSPVVMPGGGAEGSWEVPILSGAKDSYRVYVDSGLAQLTGSGDRKFQCALIYPDDTTEFNVVKKTHSDGFTFYYPLSKDAASSTMIAVKDGIHITRKATDAWADLIANTKTQEAEYRKFSQASFVGNANYNLKWKSNAAVLAYGVVNIDNVVTRMDFDIAGNVHSSLTDAVYRKTSVINGVKQGCHLNGHGVVAEFDVGDINSGILEFCSSIDVTNSIAANPAYIDSTASIIVTADDLVIYEGKNTTHLSIHKVKFFNNEKIKVTITSDQDAIFNILLHDMKLWETSGDTSPIFDVNERVVTCGDSWLAYYDGGFAKRLEKIINKKRGSGKVINSALGGMTTQWAIDNFDSLIAQYDPQHVILNFSTNDINLVGDYYLWKSNLSKLQSLCASIGARCTVIGVCDDSQTNYNWNSYYEQYSPSASYSPSECELTDSGTYINQIKSIGTSYRVNGTQLFLFSEGDMPSDGWSSSLNDRLTNVEVAAYDYNPASVSNCKVGVGIVNGYSEGFSDFQIGDNSGNTFTGSVVNGVQLLTATRTTSGLSRLAMSASNITGSRLIAIVEVKDSTPSTVISSLDNFSGSYAESTSFKDTSTDASGSALLAFDMDTSVSSGIFQIVTDKSGDYVVGVSDVWVVDVDKLSVEINTDLSGYSSNQLFDLVYPLVKKTIPSEIKITDSGTGNVVSIIVTSGVVSVV